MRRHAVRAIVVVLGTVVLGGAAPDPNAALVDWSRYARTAADLLAEQIGREVSIGAIEVETAMPPMLLLRDVRIGNADWGKAESLAEIGELRVRVGVEQLLGGRIVLPEIVLRQARIALERGPDGQTNWSFGPEEEGDDGPLFPLPVTPVVESLRIEDASFAYLDASADLQLEGRLASAQGSVTSDTGVRLSGEGTLAEQPLSFELTGDPLEQLQPGQPYALKASLRTGENEVVAEGEIGDPVTLEGVDVRLTAAGPGLATLGAGLVELPRTPPYRIAGRLLGKGDAWRIEEMDATLGKTRAVGWAELAQGEERPMVRADLLVRELHHRDLVPESDLPPEATPVEVAEETQDQPAAPFLIEDGPVPTDWLPALDAVLHLVIEQSDLPAGVDPVELEVALEDGVLHARGIEVGVAGGTLRGEIGFDGRGSPPRASVDLRYDGIKLKEAFAGTRFEALTSGNMRGHITLRAGGDRIHAMLGSLEGEVVTVMSEGTMSGLVLEGVSLDVAEALALYLSRDTPVEIRCLVADLPIRAGVGQFRRLLIDTTNSQILGGAGIDFGQQTLQLRLEGQGKDFSILDPDAPVFAQGKWNDISISVGRTAFIPLIELGLQEDAPCEQLEREVLAPRDADQDAQPAVSEPGGPG